MFSGETFADYTKHTLKFFYLERGGNVSYCYLRFNMPTLPDKSLTVAKELSGGGEALNGYLSRTMDYRFRVLRPDGSLYVPAGTTYQVLEGTSVTGSGRVDGSGCFTLRAGQMAQFTDMMTLGGGQYDYVVEETMPAAADRAVPAGAVHRGQRHRHRRHALRLHGLHRLPHRYALRR